MTQQLLARSAALFLAPFGAALAATPVDRQVSADATGIVEITNVAGSIDVIGGNRGDVHVTGTLGDNVERLDVLKDGDRVIVEVVLDEEWRGRNWDDTRLTVEVPQGSELRVNAVSASVDVRGVQGEQRLASVSGSVDVQDAASELNLSSVSGNVTVRARGRSALTRAKSVSGGIDIDGIAGELEAESVSGGVEITAASLNRARLSSISGNVRLRSGLGPDSRIEAETTSGNVTLTILGDAAGEYELSSFSGGIRNCFGPPVPPPPSVGPPSRRHRFREGTSDARIHANSLSGSINLCRQ
jgi:hypothetical protein